jgi:hypothetical protein
MSDYEDVAFSMPTPHGDMSPVELTATNKNMALEKIRDAYGALAYLRDTINDNRLKVADRYNGLSCLVGYIRDLKEAVGSEVDDLTEQAHVSKQFRAANQEIHRLKQQIGAAVSSEAVGHKLTALERAVSDWWKSIGFAYCTGKAQSTSYCVEFSCSLDDDSDLVAELDVTDRRGDPIVLHNDKNCGIILGRIQERFPGFRLWKIESIFQQSGLGLRHIEGWIPLHEIEP